MRKLVPASCFMGALSFATSAWGGGLAYALNDHGLATLTYGGHDFATSAWSGQCAPDYDGARFKASDGGVYDGAALSSTHTVAGDTVTVTFSDHVTACKYSRSGDTLFIDVTVTNTAPDPMVQYDLVPVASLAFDATPKFYLGDPGPFYASCGPIPLGSFPVALDPRNVVPLMHIDFGQGVFDFANEDVMSPVGVGVWPGSDNPPGNTVFSFRSAFAAVPIDPGKSASARFSLRFGSASSSVPSTAGDLLEEYYAKSPLEFVWNDHRPIGMDMFCNPGANVPTNPRGYFQAATDVDVTTDAGKLAFRDRMMKRADSVVAVLTRMHAQGEITWDIEGEEVLGISYYGDPTLIVNSPEMLYEVNGVATVDAYFKKIHDAGFRTGHALRPQHITQTDAGPQQYDVADPGLEMITKAKFAHDRWGSTLFYVDTTVFTNNPPNNPYGDISRSHGSLNAEFFKALHEALPDSVFFPENQSARYYAYAAPLDSYFHHGVKETPQLVRDEWPGAFTALIFDGIKQQSDVPDLVNGVKHGDILMSNCWYDSQAVDDTLSIYQQAGTLPVVNITAPVMGAELQVGSDVTITTNAAAGTGTIDHVVFAQNTTSAPQVVLGTVTSPPWNFTWKNAARGTYVLTATAFANDGGLVQTSPGVTVVVTDIPDAGLDATVPRGGGSDAGAGGGGGTGPGARDGANGGLPADAAGSSSASGCGCTIPGSESSALGGPALLLLTALARWRRKPATCTKRA